jgi:hypothetical protein
MLDRPFSVEDGRLETVLQLNCGMKCEIRTVLNSREAA